MHEMVFGGKNPEKKAERRINSESDETRRCAVGSLAQHGVS